MITYTSLRTLFVGVAGGVDTFFGWGGGGGGGGQEQYVTQSRNINLCAQSAPQNWKLCAVISSIFMLNLMVLKCLTVLLKPSLALHIMILTIIIIIGFLLLGGGGQNEIFFATPIFSWGGRLPPPPLPRSTPLGVALSSFSRPEGFLLFFLEYWLFKTNNGNNWNKKIQDDRQKKNYL